MTTLSLALLTQKQVGAKMDQRRPKDIYMVDVIHRIEIGHKSGLSLKKSEWKPIIQSCQQSRQGHKIESKSCAEINLESNITS